MPYKFKNDDDDEMTIGGVLLVHRGINHRKVAFSCQVWYTTSMEDCGVSRELINANCFYDDVSKKSWRLNKRKSTRAGKKYWSDATSMIRGLRGR